MYLKDYQHCSDASDEKLSYKNPILKIARRTGCETAVLNKPIRHLSAQAQVKGSDL